MRYILSIVVFLFSSGCYGYEIENHADMSEEASERSTLYSPSNVLDDIGIDYSSFRLNFDDQEREISEIIGLGAKFEDNTDEVIRPFRHFYDPTKNDNLLNAGLSLWFPSPIWALGDIEDVPEQEYSFFNAKVYYYKALTEESKELRDENFADLFRTIGQVIHHDNSGDSIPI